MTRWTFVADRRAPVYATLGAELAAIRRGAKAISFFASDADGLAEDLAELVAEAVPRGLCVTLAPRARVTARVTERVIDLFVHRADGAARIAPLQALLGSGPWTFAHEAKLGVLLGYSARERAAWLAAERHARPAFGVLTLYGASDAPDVWWAAPGQVVARASRHATGLWRVGVDPRYAARLDARGRVQLATRTQRAAFERAVRTPYERYTRRGWTRDRQGSAP